MAGFRPGLGYPVLGVAWLVLMTVNRLALRLCGGRNCHAALPASLLGATLIVSVLVAFHRDTASFGEVLAVCGLISVAVFVARCDIHAGRAIAAALLVVCLVVAAWSVLMYMSDAPSDYEIKCFAP